ncbi:uncharacterized protein LOC109832330 isoform X2 [Asparagus officinalis]|uniref:uncharacterized protein LOC109825836 isoform X2 n=1 Tax=Asparagus officinalis TaxID=4686 RepID=UPI00098E1948|nr:uncharacterized protein LOC109825836 isoform X2 [Asparagus officinalis]XP_020255327.1 uncharacterized protein LOC109832330 isoform X2 [Asparagus officinalis]
MASKGLKEEYGGLGPDYLYHCIAMEEISRASGSVCINQFGCSPWIFRDFEVSGRTHLLKGNNQRTDGKTTTHERAYEYV